MTKKEREIMELLVLAHNKFMELESTHPSEKKEWVEGVHKLQDCIGGRILRRDYPNDFITIKDGLKNS